MSNTYKSKIRDRIKSWKENLIDLTFRNQLLNLIPRKSRTIEIVDEYPQKALQHLLEGKSFEFDPVPEENEENSSVEEIDSEQTLLLDNPAGASEQQKQEIEDNIEENHDSEELTSNPERILEKRKELQSAVESELDEYHMDDRLQTIHDEASLGNKLLKLFRQSRSDIEETGINNLHLALGMLEWYESPNSEKERFSPILLVPVQLDRETARSGFELTKRGEEPILNPALRLKLQQEYEIEIPEIPELSDITEVEADQVFEAVQEAIEDYDNWRLTGDIILDRLKFTKYLMYKELEDYEEMFLENNLIQELCGGGEGTLLSELPESIKNADLDKEMSPWDTTQVLDADASQQRAILAVKEGHDFILEGPPGTGKSQTITNLIAEAMTDGKSVLFVSEKMAALDVVRERLKGVNLWDYCVELHSKRTNKNRFTDDLASSLDQDKPPFPDHKEKLRKLRKRMNQLQEYVSALHEPHENLGKSPYEVISRLTEVENKPLVAAEIPNLQDIDSVKYRDTLSVLDELSVAMENVYPISDHPLLGVGLENASRGAREKLKNTVDKVRKSVRSLRQAIDQFSEELGLSAPRVFGDIEDTLRAGKIIAESPGLQECVLKDERWTNFSDEIEKLLNKGENHQDLKEELNDKVIPKAFNGDLTTIIKGLENFIDIGIIRFVWPPYWVIYFEARNYFIPGEKPWSDVQILEYLKQAKKVADLQKDVENTDELGKLFDQYWCGIESDWIELKAIYEWIQKFRDLYQQEVITDQGLELAEKSNTNLPNIEEQSKGITSLLNEVEQEIEELQVLVEAEDQFSVEVNDDQKINKVIDLLGDMSDNADQIRSWSTFVSWRNKCFDTPAEDYLRSALEEEVEPNSLRQAFERRFLRDWLEKIFKERTVLADFHSSVHTSRLEEFQELDERSKEFAQERARSELYSRRKQLLKDDNLQDQLNYLQRQARLSRGIDPIRRILQKAGEVVQTIKPCIMMSPLSVAKYLPPEETHFDLLVFDEASQITPEDSVGAFVRAEQVVIVGDSKQLPPTQFFSTSSDLASRDPDTIKDLESILKEMKTAGVPNLRLLSHYRSQDEELISFSNERFYDGDLRTFPSLYRDDDFLGVKFEYLEGVTYSGGGKNLEEAQAVVDAIEEHIENRSQLSLGVGTFGQKQQVLIQDLLEERRRKNPSLEHFFNRDGEEDFFVKNLENLQGDDRDVIFISVTYGPDENENVRRNFGPVSGKNGWRRLNVLTTRAKQQVRVFSCMRYEDIKISDNPSQGVKLLHDYLEYADTGNLRDRSWTNDREPDSPFEKAVISELEKEGYEIVPQVGESGYRIDIGVLNPDSPGEFICGIECDGASYHSTATVRERDRLRQQVLEDHGWTILRVWSTDWFHDKQNQMDRLIDKIEQAKNKGNSHPAKKAIDTSRSKNEVDGKFDAEKGVEDTSDDEKSEEKPAIEDIPVPDYEVKTPDRVRPKDRLYEGSVKNIAEVVEQIVGVESPIHEEALKRRAMKFWDIDQLGSNVSKRIGKAIGYLNRKGRIEREGDFIWDPEMETPPVRSRDLEEHRFDSDHICSEEAAEAIRLLLQYREPLLQEEIPTEAVKLLGFNRAGKKLQSLMEEATEHLIEENFLRPGGYGIRLREH